MVKAELSGLSLIKGISTTELQAFLGVLGAVPRGSLGRDYWRDIAVESGYTHIEVRQMRFKRVAAADKTPSPSALAAEEALGEHEVSQVPAVLRDLIRATSTARLYPVDSDSVSEAVDALLASLQPLTDRHSAVTLANVDAFVLVNGVRVDTGKWQAVADGFIEFLNTLGLASVTFLYSLSRTDIETFLGLVREGIPSEPDPEFWDGFAEEHGLVGMAFNETGYALGAVRAQGPSTRGAGAGPGSSGTAIGTPGGTYGPPGPAMAPGDAPAPPPGEDVASPDLVARVAKELLAEGKLQEAGTLLERLFADFDQEGTQERVAVVLTCREILRQLVPGLQHTLAKLAVEPLSWALGSETHPRVLEELGTLLYQMAASAVQFADYRLASRIYAVVGERRKELLGTGSGRNTPYAALASVVLDESTQQLLVEDLQSGKPDRQERASLVLSRVGSPARRLLVNVIKQVKELRVRQVAAGMLAEMGEAGALALKETLLTEVVVEHRFRMLEVADLVTDDLRTELAFSVADEHPKIRRAAFQLFERLGNEDLIEVVLPLVEASDPAIAKGAIRSLTHLGTPRAMRAFIDILQKTDDPGLATACCQALGRPESEDAVEALQTVLDRKKLGFLGPWWPEHVRATAAAALLQIGGPWASAVLTQHAKDPSPRIREIARHAGTQGPPQNPISPEG
jgi:HEAT repeat protein